MPMQEALSAGIPVIMPNIEPNAERLNEQWLVTAKSVGSFMTRTKIDIYQTDPNWLAFKMLEFANADFMRKSNIIALEQGESMSWKQLKPYYQTIFSQVVAS